MSSRHFLFALCLWLLCRVTWGETKLEFLCKNFKVISCNSRSKKRSGSSSHPTESSVFRFNPAALSSAKGLGAEVISHRGHTDFAVISGTGKVGAAISPSSLEDTFFGNLSFETDNDYKARVRKRKVFRGKTLTLAFSIPLLGKKKGSLLRAGVGVIGKYNHDTHRYRPGTGLTVVLGYFYAGYAYNDGDFFNKDLKDTVKYNIETVNFGLNLPFLGLDYSKVSYRLPQKARASIKLLSGTLIFKKFMVTYGKRKEDSARPKYYFSSDNFIKNRKRTTEFFGTQWIASKHFLLGLFYNYYLLRSFSFSATIII